MPPDNTCENIQGNQGAALVEVIGASGSDFVGGPDSCCRNPGGSDGLPNPGGRGGSLVTIVRQIWRSSGGVSFQRSAFFRNWARFSGVISANLLNALTHRLRWSGGSFSNACKVLSISPRSASGNALRIF